MARKAMACPACGSDDGRVVDKRNYPECVYRRRQCHKCGGRYSTYELCVGSPRTVHVLGGTINFVKNANT
jgi:transcriptional repressor NrdR